MLVGVQTTAFTYGKGLATYIFVIAVVSQEGSESKVICQEITTFKVHTPTARLVGEVVAQREVVLPVDIGITVIGHLCLRRHSEDESKGGNREYSQGKIFYCFHTLFLFIGSMTASPSG